MRYFQIQFYSSWHCGAGMSGGTKTDAVVNRDENGLPYVPGKTIKGMLREAAEILSNNTDLISGEWIAECFGHAYDNEDSTSSGKLFISSAHIAPSTTRVLKRDFSTQQLSEQRAFTAMDENGVAKDSSLRVMEAIHPMKLYGSFDGLNESDIVKLEYCMGMVKEIGALKNRGFGKCQIKLFSNHD